MQFNLTSVPGAFTLHNVSQMEVVDLTGSTVELLLNITVADVLKSDTDELVILGSVADEVRAVGQGWTSAGTQVVDGQTCSVYTTSTSGTPAILLVDQDIVQASIS